MPGEDVVIEQYGCLATLLRKLRAPFAYTEAATGSVLFKPNHGLRIVEF